MSTLDWIILAGVTSPAWGTVGYHVVGEVRLQICDAASAGRLRARRAVWRWVWRRLARPEALPASTVTPARGPVIDAPPVEAEVSS